MSEASDPDLSATPSEGDSLDALLGEAVRAPVALPSLTIGDELRGRFRIDRLIGVGGMGSVYLATDTTLERQVAIKLHHAVGQAARLHREAVAMARLAHPNVIAVFEVGELGDQAFVAMEFIAGTTLRAWANAPGRTVRARLAMLIGAGTGLAAAHDVGLVHRDFKPENVLVGDDGRPRVGDFGLARGSQSQDDVVPVVDLAGHDSGALDTPLTRTGAVLGTPAYMAPEQALGGKVDARADQFAFCIVAWELLYGERPFTGANLAELVAAISSGPRRPARGGVRTAVRQVLVRGLAVDPAARHADMHDLLAALRRASRSRVPFAIGGIGILGASAVAFALLRPGIAPPSCDAAGDEVASLSHDLPARLRATGGTFAHDAGDRVADALDGFAAKYRRVATTACRADKIDHAWSSDLYRRSAACLSIRLRTAAVLVAPDHVTAGELGNLVEQVLHLPDVDGCVDPAVLAATPAPPTDPAVLEATINARARLDAASIESLLGRAAPARALLAELAGAPLATDPAIAARILLVRGNVASSEDHPLASEQAWRDAYFAARAIDDVDVTLTAVASLIQSSGELREDSIAADGWIRNGLADALRAKTRNPQGASMVYASASAVRATEDNLDEATRYAKLALELVEGTRTINLVNALGVTGGASCAAGRYEECYAAEARALELVRALLGPNHPRVGSLLASMALDRYDNDRKAEALELARQAKVIVDGSRESSSVELAHTETALGALIFNTDAEAQFPEGRALLTDARARLVATLGAEHPDVAQVDGDLALYDNADGKLADGAARLQSALAIQEHVLGPTASRVGSTLYNLAATLRDLKRYPEALAATLRAADIFELRRAGTTLPALALAMAAAIANLAGDPAGAYTHASRVLAMPIKEGHEFGRAWASMEAARSLIARRQDPARARALLGEARASFATQQLDARVTECDALLARVQ